MGAFVAPIIAGLGALTGLFGSPQKSSSSSTTTTTPNYDPASLALKNFLTGKYTDSVNNIPGWNQSYQTSGLQNILNSSQSSAQAAQDALARSGTARTTAGAQAVTDQSQQQGKQVSSFLNNAPIVEQQNLLSTLGGAGSYLASLPVGTTNVNNTNTVGGQPANPVAGLLGGGATALAGVLGQQAATNSLGNILKNLNLNPNGTSGTGSTYTPAVNSDDWGG